MRKPTEEEVKKLHDENKDTSHIVYGTMLGYGITLQMYNNKTNKGMRGLQIPAGDIQFDISFGGELVMNGCLAWRESGTLCMGLQGQ